MKLENLSLTIQGICVLLLGVSLNFDLFAACNAENGDVPYSMDIATDAKLFYCAGEAATINLTVTAIPDTPVVPPKTFTPSEPAAINWSGITSGSGSVKFGIPFEISIPAETMTVSADVDDKTLVIEIVNEPDNASPDDKCRETVTKKFTIVEVESVLPDMGLEVDDGDDNPDTRSFVVSRADSGNVTVNARLQPVVEETALPQNWMLQGGEGISRLEHTVSRLNVSNTVLTFSYDSILSPKVTKLYIYSAKLKLYADGGGVVSWGKINTGHSWWKLMLSSETVDLVPFNLQSPLLNEDCGYWPVHPEWISLLEPEDIGQVRCGYYAGGEHIPTGTHVWEIDFENLISALEHSESLATNPSIFNLLIHNCTVEACEVANHAGVDGTFSTPKELSDWLNEQ